MRIFPAIDILDGKAVRLKRGIREASTVYGDPVEFAVRWAGCGADILHIVDLNAAFDGVYVNDGIIKDIRKAVNVQIQLGGGFNSMERMAYCLNTINIDRAVIGSTAVTDPELFDRAASAFGSRIVCGIDEKDGKVAVKGWTKQSALTPLELCQRIKASGISDAVYTDISRDGVFTGVNADRTYELQRVSGINMIASGGVNDAEDIERLKRMGVYGVIIGRALYENRIDLERALSMAVSE